MSIGKMPIKRGLPRENGLLAVLCGIDGSGKTTVLGSLPGLSATWKVVSWRDRANLPFPVFSWGERPAETLVALPPLLRSLQIAGSVITDYELLMRPALHDGKNIVADSWYFKMYAKEAVLGVADPLLFQLFDRLPAPDIVIALQVDVDEAWRRKAGQVTSYEAPLGTQASFRDFQSKVQIALLERAKLFNHVIVDSNQSPLNVAAAVELILNHVGSRE